MADAARIIVCDDEPDLRETVAEYLERNGYVVTLAASGSEVRSLIEHNEFEAIVLDISMPGEDGLSVARFLRESTSISIIMLTAAGDVLDRIIGLEMGADDYLAKPVDLRELLARIRAVLRRGSGKVSEGQNSLSRQDRVSFGMCRLDLDSHKLFDSEGNEVPITAMEFALLKVFAENEGRVLNRDQLLEQAHDRGWDPFDRSIDIRISRLRKKVEQDPSRPQVIRTVRGIGYVFSNN